MSILRMTCQLLASMISNTRSPFVKSSAGSSLGVNTVPMLAWNTSFPSREKLFSCGWSPLGMLATIAPVLVSITLMTLAVEADTSTCRPSGEIAMWSARFPSTFVRQMMRLRAQVDRHDVGEARPRDVQHAAVVGREHVVHELVVTLADRLANPEEVAVALRVGLDLLHPLLDVRDDVDPGDALELARLDDVGGAVPVVAHVEDAAGLRRLARRSHRGGGGQHRKHCGSDQRKNHPRHRAHEYPVGPLSMRAYVECPP